MYTIKLDASTALKYVTMQYCHLQVPNKAVTLTWSGITVSMPTFKHTKPDWVSRDEMGLFWIWLLTSYVGMSDFEKFSSVKLWEHVKVLSWYLSFFKLLAYSSLSSVADLICFDLAWWLHIQYEGNLYSFMFSFIQMSDVILCPLPASFQWELI